jgi:hypothetical protein
VDLSELAAEVDGVSKIVLEAVQEMLLKLALQMARDDYETGGTGSGWDLRLSKTMVSTLA